ncbi:OmpA family protein [Crenothrix sp.]|uniref:OmpA family protein n=1 Tax=Crenothrix sp. TaxID=3100433 RepID=UPI00374D4E5F
MKRSTVFFAMFGFMLAGCSGTTVVLVPDASGKVGKVSVKTKAGEQLLSQAGASTFAGKADKLPTQVEVFDNTKIQDMFGTALANEPAPPLHYTLLFPSGSAELPSDATAQLKTVYQSIQTRNSCDTSVIGHSDRTGDNNTNKGISLQRAESVANVLKMAGLKGDCLDVRYYGENDPAVPTADEVAEPRNRRVEIEVR